MSNNNIVPMFKYFKLTIKHKYFVFLAGLKLQVPIWRLILHDWTKLLPKELASYGRQFFGTSDKPEEFMHTWLRHQNRFDHHWEYYIPRTGHNRCTPPYRDNEPLEMPYNAVKEMVADWLAASRAYEGKWPMSEDWEWFRTNFHKVRLHPNTHRHVLNLLAYWFRNLVRT